MPDLPSIPKRIQVAESQFRAPISESTMQKFGSTNNYLLDHYPVPPGTVHAFAGPESSMPSGYFPCDGRTVSRTTYSLLFAAIGTYWGIGDGLTTFNVPDLRGIFLRGIDNTDIGGSGRDPENLSRTPQGTGTAVDVGSYQTDANLSHTHYIGGSGAGGGLPFIPSPNVAPPGPLSSASGNADARPRNCTVFWIIKY